MSHRLTYGLYLFNPTDFDVLIVGAGMVGLSLAAALGRTSMRSA
jgi:ribulose 1,5-bisphosphate synthetase/thiazole synthase